MKRSQARTPKQTANSSEPAELPTFLDHLHELRRRLFWVVGIIAVASGAAYPFLDTIIKVLREPLGHQQLYYLTPVGGFSFSVKICMYVGILVAVPFIMYHLYRFLEPIMGNWRRSALFYVGMSSGLALAGVLFAYFFSLPGALQFLTGLNLSNITAMLTVDSYLSFVMTYLLGAALLFQIPLLLVIINTMTPIKPGGLKKSQRYVIVGAFIVAAIFSPTPDMMNQFMFALPIIVMYEFGVLLVWLQNRSRAKKQLRAQQLAEATVMERQVQAREPQPRMAVAQTAPQPAQSIAQPASKPRVMAQPHYVDIMAPRRQPARMMPPARPQAARTVVQPRTITVPKRSIDGFMPATQPNAANPS